MAARRTRSSSPGVFRWLDEAAATARRAEAAQMDSELSEVFNLDKRINLVKRGAGARRFLKCGPLPTACSHMRMPVHPQLVGRLWSDNVDGGAN